MRSTTALGVGLAVAIGLALGVSAGVRLRQSRVGSVPAPSMAPPSDLTQATSGEGIIFGLSPERLETPSDLLPSGVPVVYGFFTLAELADSRLESARWSLDGKALGAVASRDIQPDLGRPGSGRVILRAPHGKLAPGIYELELMTAQRRFRASFAVADNAAAILAQRTPADAALAVVSQTIARGVKPSGEPLNPAKRLDVGERVYYVLQYRGAEPGMSIGVSWWAGQTELKQARREIVLPGESGWAHAWVQSGAGFPPGEYSAAVNTSGDSHELGRVPFTLE